MAKAPRRQVSSIERWLGRAAVIAGLGSVVLLFWALTDGMQASSCRDDIEHNPDCVNTGPAARLLVGLALLAAILVAAALVYRRRLRHRRLVSAGWNFVPSTHPRVLLGERLQRAAGWCAWGGAGAFFLALVISGAGVALGLLGALLGLIAVALWGRGLRLRRH
jgi:hypothetical protein